MTARSLAPALIVLCTLTFISCDSTTIEDGEPGTRELTFCIPSEYKVKDVPWIPDDPLYPDTGFAFQGCSPKGNPSDGNCVLPPTVAGGYIYPVQDFRSWEWDQIDSNAFIRRILNEPGTAFRQKDRGIVQVENSSSIPWYLWNVRNQSSPFTSNSFGPGDELIAVCRATDSGQVCDRHVLGKSIALKYSFAMNDSVEIEGIRLLDQELLGVVESWRCSEKRP